MSIVLVPHSYGGAVISNVAADAGLVYVCGFAPDAGEHCFQLAGMFPGSMVGEEMVSARALGERSGAHLTEAVIGGAQQLPRVRNDTHARLAAKPSRQLA